MNEDKLEKNHNCDNINCNHNNTKGLCCLFNPDNCKYRQLQKENAELKEKLQRTEELLQRTEMLLTSAKITAYNEGVDKKALLVDKKALLKENKELKKACDETQELLDKQIEATYKLDKENAELQDENKRLKKIEEDYYDFLQKKNEEDWKGDNVVGCLNLRIEQKDKQLTKANELLKCFVWYFREGSPNLVPYKHKVKEAEQFLSSEVEK